MADSLRIQQLKNLQSQIPVANQQVAQGLQSAQDIQLKGQIKRATPGAGPGAAQQLGAAQTQASGQTALQTAAQSSKQLGQAATMGLQQQGLESQQKLGAQQRQLSTLQRGYQDRLSTLGNELKDKLLDQQLQFRQDERGRTFMNDRQLADWAKLNAKNNEEFKNYAQQAEQVSQRKIQTIEQAYKLITQQLDQELKKNESRKNDALVIKLRQQKQAIEKARQEEQAKQANKMAIWNGVGAIAGGVAGGFFTGSPQGAMAGAQLGSGAATTIGGAVS